MTIKWLEYENLKSGLKVKKINFFDDTTLLVGLSGVGKTVILESLSYSFDLARNGSTPLKPCRASLCFDINGKEYVWSYKIEAFNDSELMINEEQKYIFSYELLTSNGDVLFERNGKELSIVGYDRIPQSKSDQSILVQYSEDDLLSLVSNEFRKMYFIDTDFEIKGAIQSETFNKFKSLVSLRMKDEPNLSFDVFFHLPALLKIYIAKKYYPDIFAKIFDAVKELFMEIESIDIVEQVSSEVYVLAINVYEKQLLQSEISNGMLKTIFYLAELYTMVGNSIVLIDEFENGLGVNCIDVLSELMLYQRNDLQFIITSHHPKIINGIDYAHWKIIDREKSTIINSDSSDYGIGNSMHDSYFNLINRWEFEGKI